MNNTTDTDNMTVIKRHAITEQATKALIAFILLCCICIVGINALVALVCICLHFNRHSLKHFVNLQLLSLSMTYIHVGITAIPATLTYYITSTFPSAGICAGIMYAYIAA